MQPIKQPFSNGILAWCAACLLTSGAAQAQDKPKPDATHHHDGRAVEHVERAGSELKQAGEVAGEEAREAVREARDNAGETMREARQGASEALEQARKQAATSAKDAELVAKEAGEQARTGLEQARAKAVSFLDEAREHVRRALLNAAASLESKERQEEREKVRTQRQDVARVEQWRALREQLPASDARGNAADIDPAVTEALRVHAQRTARLARIRALADQAKDTRTVLRCDELLAKELARHQQQMNKLLSKADLPDQGEARDERKP